MGSTVAIVVTAVAVILGFLILRKVNDHSDSTTTPGGSASTSTTVDPAASTTQFTTTTLAPVDKTATKVQVANASNAGGVAGKMTTELTNDGYDMAEPTNATVSPKLDTSKVIYDAADPNGQAVAGLVAATLGGIAVEASPTPPPVKAAAFASGSGVIVLLGNDLAGKTLAQIGATSPSAAPTTTGAAVTAVPTTTG
jgi:hypothetical protein